MSKTKNLSKYLIECLENMSQAKLPSKTIPNFSLSDAYRTALEIKEIRENKKEKASGIKVGFTNKTIWDKYSVNAPIYGFMYSSTVLNTKQSFSPEKFLEPKFEPEIFFRLGKIPHSEMSDIDLISCCESFGIGIELVQSIYKGWTFKLPDTVAGFGLHGQYKILEEMAIPSDENKRVVLIDQLKNFNLTLRKKGKLSAKLISSKKLSNVEIENISKDLSETLNKDITINYEIDESLIGGIKVQIGSLMIDSSIKNKLKHFESIMLER